MTAPTWWPLVWEHGGLGQCRAPVPSGWIVQVDNAVTFLSDPTAPHVVAQEPEGLPGGWWHAEHCGDEHRYDRADGDIARVYADGEVDGCTGSLGITAALIADAMRRGFGGGE